MDQWGDIFRMLISVTRKEELSWINQAKGGKHKSYKKCPKGFWQNPYPALRSYFSSVQSLSRIWLFATPWTAARQASLSITNSRSLLKLMSIELVMPSNHPTLCPPLLLPPSIFLSIRVFSNESGLLIRWPEYWSFSLSTSPSSQYSGLISFWMDWLDLPAFQGTLKSSPTPQFKSINSSVLSFLFSPTITSIFMTTGKAIALTRRTFVGKVMSLTSGKLSNLWETGFPSLCSGHLLGTSSKGAIRGLMNMWHKAHAQWRQVITAAAFIISNPRKRHNYCYYPICIIILIW